MEKIKNIQCGVASFADVSRFNLYYVDKTIYIPAIEKTRYIFFVRPRRFGKSMFISMLSLYYDIKPHKPFEELFKGTWIKDNQTEEQGKYLILYFDFSRIRQSSDDIQRAFNFYCSGVIRTFLDKYNEFIPKTLKKEVAKIHDVNEKLSVLADGLQNENHNLYILIDEYDNFTNTLLSGGGQEIYAQITRQTGFFKDFFRQLKGMSGMDNPLITRLFMTGVSPITLDDVSSGYNIGQNISLWPEFNSLLGFTQKDVNKMLDYYIKAGEFHLDKDKALYNIKKWYDNYMFSDQATESVFNTDGVLYLFVEIFNRRSLPTDMIDNNLRIDYGKLQDLVYNSPPTPLSEGGLRGELNGNFEVLTQIINSGVYQCNINKSFPFDELKKTDNYVSLFYFFGLLTYSGKNNKGRSYLVVPNETIKHLMYGYIRSILDKAFDLPDWFFNLNKLTQALAYRGEFKPMFDYIASLINDHTKIRDFQDGEAVVKTFFNVYIRINDFYYVTPPPAPPINVGGVGGGYADIVLFPHYMKYPNMKYAYLIELKYIKREVEGNELKNELTYKINKSRIQLDKYSEDRESRKEYHLKPHGTVDLKKIIIVFHGWEMVYCEEWIMDNG